MKNETIRPLKIALTKGRIEKSAIEMFENAGINCSEIKDKGRKLIFENSKENMQLVLAKAADEIGRAHV